ncbi:MAG: insulinase family protein [Bdellovibrionales bacterium]|nr:insulinase family protein [Bdellovibrionales bacterium]
MKRFLLILCLISAEVVWAGPKLLYEEDPTLLTTTIEIVVQSGSSEDPMDKTGIATTIAELLLRGTQTKDRATFQSTLERMGGAISGSASHDTIEFSGEVIKENTDAFLDLITEFLTKPSFSEKEFKSLMQENLAAIQHIKNVNTRLGGLALRREVFAGTPLERPTQGTLKTLKAIQLKDLKDRYKNSFHKGNFLFAVASPLKKSQIEKKLEAIWNVLPDGKASVSPEIALKIPSEPTLIVVNKPHTSSGSVLMGQAGIVAKEPDRYDLYLGNFSFGGEPLVSRLFNVVRGALGWTYAIGSTYQAMGSLSKQKGLFMVYTTPSIEFTTKSLFKILNMWDSYLQGGLKKDEIDLAQDSLVNSYPFGFDSANKRLGWKVMSELYDVPVLSPSEYESKIRAIGNGELVKRLRKHHTARGWIISVVADAKVIQKQLDEEQKNIPADKRFKIAKILKPEQIIE